MCTVRPLGNRQPDAPADDTGVNFELILARETAVRLARRVPFRMHVFARDGEMMGVVMYLVLTVAVFAALGLAQKLVERL